MNTFPKAESFPASIIQSKIMGPNPLKLCEELLDGHAIEPESVVLDLGSGTGITSCMLAREYGFFTYAIDLWSEPGENMRFFEEMGLSNRSICPVKADATQGLPFATGFFDAVVSIDSYNYFGRDPEYLGTKLLPYIKVDGMLYLAFPGMVHDCHDDLPECLLASWTPEQLDYMHDMSWWRKLISQTGNVEIVSMYQMACTIEAWTDWLACDNDYARNDRAAIEAGALDYLNTIAVVLRRL
ncbi:MAG: methyltransferase domain-containing protein [Eggerthellaceae bacterium]|nr:methyltransferase domain-containing protein [Eggerthellaceae bacterium]